MKKILPMLLILLMIFTGCKSVYNGDSGLIACARKEISIADAGTIDLELIGSAYYDDVRIAWFMTGNEYQTHSYIPIEFKVVAEDSYEFVRVHKPYDRGGQNNSVLFIDRSYCFMVNDPECAAIKITDDSGKTEMIAVDTLPFIYLYEGIPSQYDFVNQCASPIV